MLIVVLRESEHSQETSLNTIGLVFMLGTFGSGGTQRRLAIELGSLLKFVTIGCFSSEKETSSYAFELILINASRHPEHFQSSRFG